MLPLTYCTRQCCPLLREAVVGRAAGRRGGDTAATGYHYHAPAAAHILYAAQERGVLVRGGGCVHPQ